MEKVASPARIETSSAPRSGPIRSIVAALVGPICVVFLTGYLAIQLQLSEIGAPLLDLNGRPVHVASEWLPFLLRAALVLLSAGAILGYRLAVRTEAATVVTLVVLVLTAFAGAYTSRPLPMDGEPQLIALFSFINGATSLFILALIGAGIADLISGRRRGKPTTPR